jgi:hypothetical protein
VDLLLYTPQHYSSLGLLCFRDAAAEAAFAHKRATQDARRDLYLTSVQLPISIMAYVCSLHFPDRFWHPHAHAAYIMAIALQLQLLWCWQNTRLFLAWREAAMFGMRSVLSLLCAVANQGSWWWVDGVHGHQPSFKALLLGSGAISNIWLCFAYPMRFR